MGSLPPQMSLSLTALLLSSVLLSTATITTAATSAYSCATNRDLLQRVTDGIETELFIMNPTNSLECNIGFEFLPEVNHLKLIENRIAWTTINSLASLFVSLDLDPTTLMEADDTYTRLRSSLGSNICNWVSQVIGENLMINCASYKFQQLHTKIDAYEIAVRAHNFATKMASKDNCGSIVSERRCAWLKYNLLNGGSADTCQDSESLVEALNCVYKCPLLPPAGEYALCSI